MNHATTNAKAIDVTAMTFKNKGQLSSIPRRIEFDNQVVTFVDSGMQYLVQKGQEFIKLFDMTDGQTMYRLRYDPQQNWTLVSMRPTAKM